MLTWKDRVKQAVSAGGTGALTLGSAASGYQALAAGDDGKLFAYVIEDGTAWETGYGTYANTGTAFTRTSRTDSSTGSALNVTTNAFIYVDIVSTLAKSFNCASQSIIPGGRLTLESGVPVSSSDQSAKTTVYYTPYIHDIINLWDGNRWNPVQFTETSLALGTITSAKPYDVFGYLSSGALVLELLAWTDDTTRATAVTLQDGRYCKSGDKTRLLLGTFYTTATTTTEDSATKRYLNNVYNKKVRQGYLTESTSHTYNSATRRAWNNTTTGTQLMLVLSLEETFFAAMRGYLQTAASGQPAVGICLDQATTLYQNFTVAHGGSATTDLASVFCPGMMTVGAGRHYLQATEAEANSATSTFASCALIAGIPC